MAGSAASGKKVSRTELQHCVRMYPDSAQFEESWFLELDLVRQCTPRHIQVRAQCRVEIDAKLCVRGFSDVAKEKLQTGRPRRIRDQRSDFGKLELVWFAHGYSFGGRTSWDGTAANSSSGTRKT